MATQAQIAANRSNAQKSTGPRTAEGKAKVSQNAVRHGLRAEQAVIKGEDPAEFERFRADMLDELAPVGALESMLAGRIVGLAWRLRRAERLQNEAFDYLYLEEASDPRMDIRRIQRSTEPDGSQGDPVAGKVIVGDFGNGKAFERLLMYERRIEQSLYRAMAELKKLGQCRQADAMEEDPTPEPAPVEEDSRDADNAAQRVESARWEAGSEPVGRLTSCEEESDAETRRRRDREKREVCCLKG